MYSVSEHKITRPKGIRDYYVGCLCSRSLFKKELADSSHTYIYTDICIYLSFQHKESIRSKLFKRIHAKIIHIDYLVYFKMITHNTTGDFT